MANYSPNGIVDMILVLGTNRNNHHPAAWPYPKRYPYRRHLDDKAIRRLTQRARGRHMVRQHKRHEYDENDNRVATIFAVIYLDPHISARRVERKIGIPRSIIFFLK